MHAIVIGVGFYPHLLNGGGDLTSSHDGMRQLTSPPISARLMADWFIEKFHHPGYPGKTVSLLLAESSPKEYVNPVTAEQYAVELANFDEFSEAISRWKERGNQHIDDLLIFYFCGHGISEGNSMVILPSDFGSNKDNAYRNAIDFVSLYDALAQYKARHQFFFVDACRSSSDTLSGNNGVDLLQVRPRTVEGVRIAPIFYSTLSGDAAHGRKGKSSIFTEALVDSLNDFAAVDNEGEDDWRVSNFTLSRTLDHLMKREMQNGTNLTQVPDSTEIRDEFYLNHLKSTPKTNLYIESNPEDKLEKAHLHCTVDDTFLIERDPEPGKEWSVSIPSGEVSVNATLDGELNPRPDKQVHASPPFKRVRLDLA
ncbi:MAG: hypothetical protein GY761_17910 [Hyphomicrobiales bacterium]|nr:hypothetical protein [Hyphomicrobiales bacterium]